MVGIALLRDVWGILGWAAVYQPGPTSVETVLSVETLLFSVEQDPLLWAGVSKTANQQSVPDFTRDLVTGVGGELNKAGLRRKQDIGKFSSVCRNRE